MVMLSVIWSLFGQEWTKKAHRLSYIFSFYTFLVLALVIYNVVGVYLQIDELGSFYGIFDSSETALVFIITCINVASSARRRSHERVGSSRTAAEAAP